MVSTQPFTDGALSLTQVTDGVPQLSASLVTTEGLGAGNEPPHPSTVILDGLLAVGFVLSRTVIV